MPEHVLSKTFQQILDETNPDDWRSVGMDPSDKDIVATRLFLILCDLVVSDPDFGECLNANFGNGEVALVDFVARRLGDENATENDEFAAWKALVDRCLADPALLQTIYDIVADGTEPSSQWEALKASVKDQVCTVTALAPDRGMHP